MPVYKTFTTENIVTYSLGDLEGALGDELRNFKKGIIKYPKLILNAFRDFYNNCESKYDIVLFIPSNKSNGIMKFFAEEISKLMNVKYSDSIYFTKSIKEQKLLDSLLQRKLNASDSIGVRNKEELHGKNILLIDDVYASGETLKEAIKSIKLCNIGKLEALTFTFRNYTFPD